MTEKYKMLWELLTGALTQAWGQVPETVLVTFSIVLKLSSLEQYPLYQSSEVQLRQINWVFA